MILKATNIRPSCGWIYVQEETRVAFSEKTHDAIVEAVRRHRTANGLSRTAPADISFDVQTYICERLRGTRALWTFCVTRFDAVAFQPHPPDAPANPCPICAKRKAAQNRR